MRVAVARRWARRRLCYADTILQAPATPQKTQRQIQWLGILSVAVPLFIFALFGFSEFVQTRQDAELRVSRSLRVAHEHASKVIAGAEELSDRLHDLVDGRGIADLRADEPRLHAILAQKMQDQPQLQSIWIIAADGRAIATSRFAKVSQELSFLDRDYLQYHQQGNAGRFLSQPLRTKTTNEKIINLSVSFNTPDGQFGGVICISLMTGYFHQFYEDLVADEPGLAITLFGQGGAVYTRYPDLAEPGAPPEAPASGLRAGARPGGERLPATRRVGAYPLYMETAMDLAQVRNEVFKQLGVMLAFGLPPFAALFFTARLAQRRSRETLEAAQRLEQEVVTRRKAEEALLQAQKLEALGRLTGGVAHDFNNALMVINNSAYLLKRHVNEGGQRPLEAIARAVDSATRLTRQLLAFSRRQALVPELLRLQDRLPPLKDLLGPVLGSQVALAVEVAPDTRLITVDAAELELALLNLGINARDAMPAGGSFTLSARNADGEMPGQPGLRAVAISAADTGLGIEPTALPRVFEPFFTTKPVGQGTGLGLSQVYGLCHRAGGVAHIASVVGSGTAVTLYFPAADTDQVAPDTTQPKAGAALGKSVLLVEDNDDVAASLLMLLDALGCKAVRVDRAVAALEWLEARQAAGGTLPDLVLTDVVMPGQADGMALARHVRDTWPHQPLLLMTGYAQQIEAITQQGFTVLPKPCSAEQLSAAIARATRAS